MSAPPGTNSEYSRGSAPFWRLRTGFRGRPGGAPAGASGARPAGLPAVVLAAALGALIVIVSQFTTLYAVHVATSSVPVKTVGTGANHAWAPLPLALLALAFAFVVLRQGSRVAAMAIAVLGIATLLIALLGDLPDAHASGLIGSGANQYAQAVTRASAGLYIETLGAVLLLIGGGSGFLLLSPTVGRRRAAADGGDAGPDGLPGRPTPTA